MQADRDSRVDFKDRPPKSLVKISNESYDYLIAPRQETRAGKMSVFHRSRKFVGFVGQHKQNMPIVSYSWTSLFSSYRNSVKASCDVSILQILLNVIVTITVTTLLSFVLFGLR